MTAPIPDEFLDLMAEKFRMLADPTRLAILREPDGWRAERHPGGRGDGRNQANVSKHLKMLAEAGLVGRRKEGLQVFYTLDDPLVERLCKLVCETIVEEAREEVEQKRKLLQGWGERASMPTHLGRAWLDGFPRGRSARASVGVTPGAGRRRHP